MSVWKPKDQKYVLIIAFKYLSGKQGLSQLT